MFNRTRILSASAILIAAGCSTPMGLERVSPRQAYVELHQNALNSGRYSADSEQVLYRYDLIGAFKRDQSLALARLHDIARDDRRADVLYALSELSYWHAEKLSRSFRHVLKRQARDYYFASAIYASMYLLGEAGNAAPGLFDQARHVAIGLYNRGLALGLMIPGSDEARVDLAAGARRTPPGLVQVSFAQPGYPGKIEEVESFQSADDFQIRGLTPRNRTSGLGAPLIAVNRSSAQAREVRRAPATVFLRVAGDVRDWSAGRLRAGLELYSGFEASQIEAGGKVVPLQADNTAPIADALSQKFIWKLGKAQFFAPEVKFLNGIHVLQPYVPGRIPVVFVHGTASSPIRWAQMWNMLRADPVLSRRYQFWSFSYATGNPITFSAGKLRDDLTAALQEFDPEGKDQALRQMVIVGHSQGGLLAKLIATETGDKLWRTVSKKSFEEIEVPPKVREVLKKNLFATPMPCVKRVIFIATPHRGSYRDTHFIRKMVTRFMTLPADIMDSYSTLMNLKEYLELPEMLRRGVPTSIRGMSPENPFTLVMAGIPVAPGIKANSIIAIKGKEQPPAGEDGVVKYTSAHVDYAESEMIVRSAHSCQSNPHAIEEVRRILLEHLRALSSR